MTAYTVSMKFTNAGNEISPALAQIKADLKNIQGAVESKTAAMETAAVVDVTAAKAIATVGVAAEKATGHIKGNSVAIRESLVMMREISRGDMTRLAGSASIFAQAVGLLPLIISPVGLTITAVAATFAGFAAAINAGQKETALFNNSIRLTGNFAGQTADSMHALADSVSKQENISLGAAKNIVTELVSSGRVGKQTVESLAGVIAKYAEATGEDVGKVSKLFIKMFDDPAKGALEMSKAMHNLTAEQVEHIRLLTLEGKEEEARKIMADAANKTLEKTTENLGFVGKALKDTRKWFSEFWDAAENAGRTQTTGGSIAHILDQLAKAQTMKGPGVDAYIRTLETNLQLLQRRQLVENATAADEQKNTKNNQLQTEALERSRHYSHALKLRDIDAEITAQKEAIRVSTDASTTLYLREGLAGLQKKRADLLKKSEPKKVPSVDVDVAAENEKSILLMSELVNGHKKLGLAEQFTLKIEKELSEGKKIQNVELYNETLARLQAIDALKAQNAADEQADKAAKKANETTAEYILKTNDEIRLSELKLSKDKGAIAAFEREIKLRDERRKLMQIEHLDSVVLEDDLAKMMKAYDDSAAAAQRADEASKTSQAGFKLGMEDYKRTLEDVADRTRSAVVGGFKTMEDALVQFTTTGKLSWGSLEQSILAGMNRLIIQQAIMKPMQDWLSGATPSSSGFQGLVGSAISFGLGLIGGTPAPAGATPGYSLSAGATSSSIGLKMPSHAVGTDFVPYDMVSQIHAGERIVPASSNKDLTQYLAQNSGGGGMSITNHFTLNEPTNQRTQSQIAAATATAMSRAAMRNN